MSDHCPFGYLFSLNSGQILGTVIGEILLASERMTSLFICIVCILEVPVVIYERQKNRKTEQADGIPKPSQGESLSTSVYQALQSEEEIQNIDADYNLKDDINSSETHSIAHKSEFSFIMPPHI